MQIFFEGLEEKFCYKDHCAAGTGNRKKAGAYERKDYAYNKGNYSRNRALGSLNYSRESHYSKRNIRYIVQKRAYKAVFDWLTYKCEWENANKV